MNEQQKDRGEKIAEKAMRMLATLGLVAVLALVAWLVVQGVRHAPRAGEGLTAAVSVLQTIFTSAPQEALSFQLDARTLPSSEQVAVRWEYIGEHVPALYTFSYSCAGDVTLSVRADGQSWTDLACDTPYQTEQNVLQVIATSPTSTFADVEVTVRAGELHDTTLVTVTNMRAVPDATTTDTVLDEPSTSEPPVHETPAPVAPIVPVPPTTAVPTQTVPSVTTPIVSGPSDLSINILETGVLAPVAGENTFFPVSPIPSDKTAAVRFSVTNVGGQPSGPWSFIANLPIEGDNNYRYVAPAQDSMAPGMEVLFTLGFDQLLDSKNGTIRIEVVPTLAGDRTTNNVDAASVSIYQK